jgi:hypothetical protein
MLDTFIADPLTKRATYQEQRANWAWSLWYFIIIGLSGLTGFMMLRSGPSINTIAWLIYLTGVIAIFIRPRYGVYLTVFFSLLGDSKLVYWYPFSKNFSSRESILFLHDALIISPLESYMIFALLAWLAKDAFQRKISIYRNELFWPVMAFSFFMAFGLLYGIGTGGNLNIALWEARAIFYLGLMFVLTSNLLEKREHVSHLMWFAMVALFIEGWAGVNYYIYEIEMDLTRVESITEHSAAIHMNTFFVFMCAVWLYKGSVIKRIALPLMVSPVLLTYVATQRRASFLTLGVALFLMAFPLYKESKRVFWLIVPPMAVLSVVYLAAFWNSSGGLALPAQAVKSVVAEDDSNAADQASNIYREIENINSAFTIHQAPLTGVGFGKKFFIIAPMPDISFFEWWEYITHNSIIWLWMKTGLGGFFSMLIMISLSVMVGIRATWRMPSGDLAAAALTGTLYVIMHFVYAYVDMSWDSQSMLYMGTMIGLITRLEYIVEQPIPLPEKRWPWQPNPEPPPGLEALPEKQWGFK